MHRGIVETNLLPIRLLSYIYDNTYKNSELRRFIAHAIASRFNEAASFGSFPAHWTKDSLMDLASFLITRPKFIGSKEYCEIELCEWHIREAGVKCAKNTDPPKPPES